MRVNKKVLAGVFAGAILAGGGLATGVAYASIPDSSTGVLTACRVTGDAGNVRIIDKQAGASCHSYETEVSWDTTPGLAGRQIVSNTISVSYGSKATATATCPAGKVAVGGGWYTDDVIGAVAGVAPIFSKPVDSGGNSTWQVRGYNTQGSATDLTAYAVCVSE
jgi:hypothetical protein